VEKPDLSSLFLTTPGSWRLILAAVHSVLLPQICLSSWTETHLTHSGKINGSQLQWSVPLWCPMNPPSGNQNSIYSDASGYFSIVSRLTKATVHPVERSGALQLPTCALVANAKWCHILSIAPSHQAGRWTAAIAVSWWRCYGTAEDMWLVNTLTTISSNCISALMLRNSYQQGDHRHQTLPLFWCCHCEYMFFFASLVPWPLCGNVTSSTVYR